MAVDLENRYKGIRMPHKFKMGVSGCTRECAEAQGKDVGLIAVKGGYNVYVCGNGGMKPKHAELLATDLSEAEAVKLIDRFIMFYCRTADRLQRTARWLENLEGGMDYLKKVRSCRGHDGTEGKGNLGLNCWLCRSISSSSISSNCHL